MSKLANYKTSLMYIIFEGLSRGGNTFIFLFATASLTKSEYINLIALFSLETLLLNISPLFYTEVLYKMRDKYSMVEINQNISMLTLIYFVFLLLIIIIFNNYISDYYETSLIVLISIIFNSCIRILFQNLSTNYQIDEKHKKAIKNKALPFFVSFIFGLFGFIFFESKILFFFIGRLLGFIIVFIYYLRLEESKLKFNLNKELISEFFSKSIFMVIKGLMAWFLGYGILNFLKLNYSEEVNFNVALMLNLWTLMLLIANGINSVYVPRFRIIFNNGGNFLALEKKVIVVYIIISILLIVLYFIIYLSPLKKLIYSTGIDEYFSVFHYVIFIFIAQIFQFVSTPYYYVCDKYNLQSFISVLTSLISIALIYYQKSINFLNIYNVVYIIIFGYFIRSLPLYLYSEFFLKPSVRKS